MRLLFNLFTGIALTTRPHARPLFAVAAGLGVAGGDSMPKDMFYGMYALRDRYFECLKLSPAGNTGIH